MANVSASQTSSPFHQVATVNHQGIVLSFARSTGSFKIECYVYITGELSSDELLVDGDPAAAAKDAAPYVKLTGDLKVAAGFGDGATVDTFFHNQDFYSRHLPTKVLFADKDGRLYQRRISQYQVRPVAGDSCFPALTERVEAEEELARYRQELRALTSELALAEERERR
ncbi:MAG: hypothetical protein GY856_48720, partial [bacterium]|nr:hypothetical protein [bacterium]